MTIPAAGSGCRRKGRTTCADLFRQLEAPLGVTFTDDERKDRDRGYQRIRTELERRPPTLVVLDNWSKPTLFDPAHLSRLRTGREPRPHPDDDAGRPADRSRGVAALAVPLDRLSRTDGRALLKPLPRSGHGRRGVGTRPARSWRRWAGTR